jgi:hypothetical protein
MKTNFFTDGRVWPWAIVLGIVGIVIAVIQTIVVAMNNPVQMSDSYMQNYHLVDKDINNIIAKEIAFNKKYTLTFDMAQFDATTAQALYTLVDKTTNKGIDDANFTVIFSRPDEVKHNTTLKIESIKEGVYTFEPIKLPKEGRWNVFTFVKVGKDERHHRIKLDTRLPKTRVPFSKVMREE